MMYMCTCTGARLHSFEQPMGRMTPYQYLPLLKTTLTNPDDDRLAEPTMSKRPEAHTMPRYASSIP